MGILESLEGGDSFEKKEERSEINSLWRIGLYD